MVIRGIRAWLTIAVGTRHGPVVAHVVGTLRKALTVMTERGLLERRQGSGNYIRRRNDQKSFYSLLHLELAAGGDLPTAEVLLVDSMAKPDNLPGLGMT